jgi:hypothetical protein
VFPVFDVAEIAEEAAERAGVEFRAGYLLRSARRSIELLSIEWGNRGLNLWTIEEQVIDLVPGKAEYVLPDDTIDLIEHSIRRINASGEPAHVDLRLHGVAQQGGPGPPHRHPHQAPPARERASVGGAG